MVFVVAARELWYFAFVRPHGMFTACLVWTVSHFVFPCLFIVQVSVEEWILECGLAVCA